MIARPWRRTGAALLLSTALAATASCAATSSSETASSPSSPSGSGSEAPLVDANGTAVPSLRPDARVVDLGFLSLDLVDMGVTPVAGYAEPIRAALTDGLEDRDAATVLADLAPALSPAFEVETEQLVELDPDVIVTTTAYASAFGPALEQLAKVAPVVVLDGAATWRARATFLGRLLGREAEADDAVRRTEAAIADARTALAPRAGATVAVLRLGATEVGGDLEAYVPPSFPTQVVTDLGLSRPAAEEVAAVEGQPDVLSRIAVSLERVVDHDADLVVDMEVAGATDPSAVTGSPVWEQLAAVREGRVVTVSYLVWSVPSTLSVRQMVADVVAGLEAT